MSINLIGTLSVVLILVGLAIILLLNRKGNRFAEVTEKNDQLANEALQILTETYPETLFTYDPRSDTITGAEGDTKLAGAQLFLGNLRNRTQDMGTADRADYFRKFIKLVGDETEITRTDIEENMLMRCRTPEEFSLRSFVMQPDPDKPPFEPIIFAKGEMLFEPVLNSDNAVRPMNVEIMRKLEYRFEEFINLGARNLLSVTPVKAENHWEKLEDDIWISRLNDDFDAARLFLFPEELSLPIDGQIIAFAPSHAICLITSSDKDAVLMRMMELGSDSAQTHRPLSQALWLRENDGWSRLDSQDRHSTIGRARLSETLGIYADQAETLHHHFEARGEDIHVASVMTRVDDPEAEKPKIETLAVFIGQGGYMPEVDFVILGMDELKKGQALEQMPWGKFREIMGDRLLPHPDLLPPRYICQNPLNEETIAALKSAADTIKD